MCVTSIGFSIEILEILLHGQGSGIVRHDELTTCRPVSTCFGVSQAILLLKFLDSKTADNLKDRLDALLVYDPTKGRPK
jgi:hypothetical protein